MPKRIEGGATTPSGKKIIGITLMPKLKDRIQEVADKIGITRNAFCTMAILNELKRYEGEENGGQDFSC